MSQLLLGLLIRTASMESNDAKFDDAETEGTESGGGKVLHMGFERKLSLWREHLRFRVLSIDGMVWQPLLCLLGSKQAHSTVHLLDL